MNQEVHIMDATLQAEPVQGYEHRDDDHVGRKPRFVYDVDGVTYRYDQPTITGAEIMAAVGIPLSDGLVQLLPDGAAKTIGPDDVVHLVQKAHFKRRPRFKRG